MAKSWIDRYVGMQEYSRKKKEDRSSMTTDMANG